VKYFAASKVLEHSKDRTWLAKLTNTINQHWKTKNAPKKKLTSDDLALYVPEKTTLEG
jgi:hypothetical protein